MKNLTLKLNGQNLFKVALVALFVFVSQQPTFAQSGGTTALQTMLKEIQNYYPIVQKIIYGIACIVAIVGGLSVFHKMQNGDQDVSKSIMMLIGGCAFLIAFAASIPLFFK